MVIHGSFCPAYTPCRLTWNMSSWRFVSDQFPFFSWGPWLVPVPFAVKIFQGGPVEASRIGKLHHPKTCPSEEFPTFNNLPTPWTLANCLAKAMSFREATGNSPREGDLMGVHPGTPCISWKVNGAVFGSSFCFSLLKGLTPRKINMEPTAITHLERKLI